MTWLLGRGSTKPAGAAYIPTPHQAMTITYEDTISVPYAQFVSDWGRPGALIIAGRVNYNDSRMVECANRGATVTPYLDCLITNPYGRYHTLLLNASPEFGARIPEWPGGPDSGRWRANSIGSTINYLSDFREGALMHQPIGNVAARVAAFPWMDPTWTRLEAILELMAYENPTIGGFFADDLGSRSYFADLNWTNFGATYRSQYRLGAIEISKAFDRVCKRHQLVYCANGTWNAGINNGGGYPNVDAAGLASAALFMIENHPAAEYAYGVNWGSAPQWGDSSITGGPAYPVVIVNENTQAGEFANWAATGVPAYLGRHYGSYTTMAVYGSGRANGLPSRVSNRYGN